MYASEREAVNELGIDEESWDCWVNHYVGLYWSTIEERGLEKYYIALGWSLESWEGGADEPATKDLYWDELSLDQQNAATNLCYFKNLWNQDPIGVWQFDVDAAGFSATPQTYGAIFPKVRFVSLHTFESFADNEG